MEQKVKYAINLISENGQVVVSSREVAEHFGKEHKTVLRSIEELAAQNCATKSMFYETTFENRGKQYPMYLDCLLDILREKEEVSAPIMFPTLKS